MALTLGDNFSYMGSKPLDARLKYDTVAAMKAMADSILYDGCLAYCAATDKTYQWKSTNPVDPDLGKWREFTSGSGGASDLADLGDVNLSSPSNNDVLKYDSASGKWVNGQGGSEVSGHIITNNSGTDMPERDKLQFQDMSVTDDSTNGKTIVKPNTVTASRAMVSDSNGKPSASDTTATEIGYVHGVTGAIQTQIGNLSNLETTAKNNLVAAINEAAQGGGGSSYTAGDGIDITNEEISTDNMPSADMSEVISPLPGVMSRRMKYSTEEQVIGQWIDGKPVYQKTVTGIIADTPSSGTSVATEVDLSSLNISSIVRMDGVYASITNPAWTFMLIGRISDNSGADTLTTVQMTYGNTNHKLVIRNSMPGGNGATFYATLQYTKTTD